MHLEISNLRPKDMVRSRILGSLAVVAALLVALTVAAVTNAPQAAAKAGYRMCVTTQGNTVYFAQLTANWASELDCGEGAILGSPPHSVEGNYITCEEFTAKYEHGTLGSDPAFNGDICDFKWPGGAWAVYRNYVYSDKFNGLNPQKLGPMSHNYF